MRYERKLELLNDALKRIMATGVSRSEAKRDLCAAIADHMIGVWMMSGSFVPPSPHFPVGSPKIPFDLNPRDFNWKHSRPKEPWPGKYDSIPVTKIKLVAEDVTRVFGVDDTPPNSRDRSGVLTEKTDKVPSGPPRPNGHRKSIKDENSATKALARKLKSMPEMTFEPPRVCRRLFRLSHAAMAGCSVMA
jgi:hypothetical protein